MRASRARWVVPAIGLASVVVLGVAVMVALTGDGPAGTAAGGAGPTSDALEWIVELREVEGGCQPGVACLDRAIAEEGDGTWQLFEGLDDRWRELGGTRRSSGAVDPAAVATLGGWYADHHERFTAVPRGSGCGDGPETVIVVSGIPTGPDAHLADAMVLETSSCQHVWPPELFERLLAVWDEAGIPRVEPRPR